MLLASSLVTETMAVSLQHIMKQLIGRGRTLRSTFPISVLDVGSIFSLGTGQYGGKSFFAKSGGDCSSDKLRLTIQWFLLSIGVGFQNTLLHLTFE